MRRRKKSCVGGGAAQDADKKRCPYALSQNKVMHGMLAQKKRQWTKDEGGHAINHVRR